MELEPPESAPKGSISKGGPPNPKSQQGVRASKTIQGTSVMAAATSPRNASGSGNELLPPGSPVKNNAPQQQRNTTVLCVKKPGEFFGEGLLGAQLKHSTTAVTLTGVTVLVLSKAKFQKYLASHSEMQPIFASVGGSMEKSLQKIEFLKGVPADKMKLMVSMFKYVPLHKDAILYSENDFDREAGNSLYFLYEGVVSVSSTLTDKEGTRTVQLNTLKQGEFFGEVGLMMDIPRTATIQAQEHCMLLELSQKNFRNFIIYVPDILAKFNDKMLEYNINLRYFIHNPIVLESFIKHCRSEYSTENIEFWMACKEFRKMPDTLQQADPLAQPILNPELIAKAQEIRKTYIGGTAASQVNLKGRVESELVNRFNKAQYNNRMFIESEDEILNLMSQDSFGRFKGSELFKTCLETVNSPYTEILRRLYLL